MDRRGRAHDRHDGRRSAPLRALRDARLPAPQERGGLRQRLHGALSGRGARRGAAPEARAVLRPHEGARRRVRLGLRLGAAELVRAGRLSASRRPISPSPTCSSTRIIRRSRTATPSARSGVFRRSNYFDIVGREAATCTRAVGLQDMSAFAKYEVSGPGAEAFLDGLVANKLPQKVGRLALTPPSVAERRRALRVHGLRARPRTASTSSAWARPSGTISITSRSCARATAPSICRR